MTTRFMGGRSADTRIPRNDRDFLFRRIPADRRHLVQADFAATRGGDAPLAAVFDIVLGGDGTPRA